LLLFPCRLSASESEARLLGERSVRYMDCTTHTKSVITSEMVFQELNLRCQFCVGRNIRFGVTVSSLATVKASPFFG